jgi:hypothetical protein
MLEISEARRFGLRYEFVVDLHDDLEAAIGAARTLIKEEVLPEAKLASFEVAIETATDAANVSLRIRPAKRKPTEGMDDELPLLAMMFDVDFYQARAEGDIPVHEFHKFARLPARWIAEELPTWQRRVLPGVRG